MALVMTGGDALRVKDGLGIAEATHLVAVGAIHGAYVEQVAARNGPGIGRMRTTGIAANRFAWKAPGSDIYGPAVEVTADGTVRLVDGGDRDKWIRVVVDVSKLLASPAEGQVLLGDVFRNMVVGIDVTAAEAAAGNVVDRTVRLQNVSVNVLYAVTVWIDALVSGIEISDDGVVWVAPTTEASGLLFGDIAVAAFDTLHMRRTILAGAASSAEVLDRLHVAYQTW